MEKTTGLGEKRMVFLIGPPGCNKGKLGEKLAEDYDYTYIDIGRSFREEINKGSQFGNLIKRYVEDGKLVPDEIVIEKLISDLKKKEGKAFLIAGFPRTDRQAGIFESAVAEIQMILSFSAPEELLIEQMRKRYEKEQRVDDRDEAVEKRFQEFATKTSPTIHYYDRLGKLRTVHCSRSIVESYDSLLKEAFPETYMVIGPKSGGKTVVCKYMAKRMLMEYINFQQFAENCLDPQEAIHQMIQALHRTPRARVVIDGFPESVKQLQYYMANAAIPKKIVCINATESQCFRLNSTLPVKERMAPPILCKKIKEFYDSSKELFAYVKKQGLLLELENSEGKSIENIQQSCNSVFDPEIVFARYEEGGDAAFNSMIEQLGGTTEQYHEIHVPFLCKEEIMRKTELGQAMQSSALNENPVPAEVIVSSIKKVVYGPTRDNKFLLTGFPENVDQLKIMEENCCKIVREFCFHSPEDSIIFNLFNPNLETFMHKEGRLSYLTEFSSDLMDHYQGVDLQYALVLGPPLSGKTTISKFVERSGFTLIDIAVLSEDLKKKLSNEENPPESINLTFDQILEELRLRTVFRSNKSERFVIDGLPFDSLESMKKVLSPEGIGIPSFLLELECEMKELKARYMKKNELTELNEEQTAEFDKSLSSMSKVHSEMMQVASVPTVKHQVVHSDVPEDRSLAEVRSIFEPKLLLLKHDPKMMLDTVLINLSYRFNFQYLSAPQLIKQEIEQNTSLGFNLLQSKKPKVLNVSKEMLDDFKFSPLHFDPKYVIELLKKAISAGQPGQMCIIDGLLNSHNLIMWEDSLELRAMDELFKIERELGEIKFILNLTQQDFDEVEDVRIPEQIQKVQKEEKKEVPKEGAPEEEAPPPVENIDPEAKPQFIPENYMWTNTMGKPRTVGQIFRKWKKCECKFLSNTHIHPEASTCEAVLYYLLPTLNSSSECAYIQVKFP